MQVGQSWRGMYTILSKYEQIPKIKLITETEIIRGVYIEIKIGNTRKL